MRKILVIVILLTIVSCASHYKGADQKLVKGFEVLPSQTLLVVKVTSSEYTGIYPYSCPAETCIPFYFWFKYEAEVLDVVKGTFDASKLSSRRSAKLSLLLY